MTEVLLPNENPQVHRKSSIDQFRGFLGVWKQGGIAPIKFDMLDGITCDTIKTHPVILDLSGKSLGYIYPEAHCHYISDTFITATKQGVETAILPKIFGGDGETYEYYTSKDAFINFSDASLGVRNNITLRTGLEYVEASETLPSVD